MKMLITKLSISFLLIVALTTYAKDNGGSEQALHLYQKPDTESSVMAQVKPSEELIPIITKDDQWLKVAKAADGTVGWLKRTELAKQQLPSMHQLTITENSDNGKRVIHYQGNRELSKKQVKQLLKQMRQQQTAAEKRMRRAEREMDREMKAMESMFNEPLFEPSPDKTVLQPVIIKTEHSTNKQTQNHQQQNAHTWWHQLKERMKIE